MLFVVRNYKVAAKLADSHTAIVNIKGYNQGL